MIRRILVFFCLLTVLTGLSGLLLAEGGDTYRLDTGDVITVTVWGHDDLKAQVKVEPDGRVSLPLIGEVEVRGLTLAELQQLLATKLAEYVRSPQVSVSLAEQRQISVKIMGEVNRPGAYLINPEATLPELIAMAGGPTEAAALEGVQHLKGGNPEAAAIIPLGAGAKFAASAGTIRIQLADGDVIIVPKAKKVKVFGEVNRPGEYTVQPGETVADLIAEAGGPTDAAALESVQLFKGGDMSKATTVPQGQDNKFDARSAAQSPEIADGDSISVPKAKRYEKISVKVFGEVNRPGEYQARAQATIAELIAMAGGPTKRAALESVQLLKGGDPTMTYIFPQGKNNRFGAGAAVRGPQLMDGDVIYVPETKRIDWQMVVYLLGGILTLLQIVNPAKY